LNLSYNQDNPSVLSVKGFNQFFAKFFGPKTCLEPNSAQITGKSGEFLFNPTSGNADLFSRGGWSAHRKMVCPAAHRVEDRQ